MDWINYAWGAACIGFGYSLRALTTDVRYPRPKHKWVCQKCPTRIGASDREALKVIAEQHMEDAHGVRL